MNHITELIRGSRDIAEFAAGYVAYLSRLLARLDVSVIEKIAMELEAARAGDHTVFIAGNGGSAATASHIVNDLLFGTRTKPRVPTFRAMSLVDSTSLVTAVANDVGYEDVFVRQLETYYRPGDRLIVITASGNSPNVVAAAAWVKTRGGRVIGLLGFDGGAVKSSCDVALIIPAEKGEYGPVEDVHLVIDHILTVWLQHHVISAQGATTAGR
jgi:D-sedoheptulose 7-phosphate isomerase